MTVSEVLEQVGPPRGAVVTHTLLRSDLAITTWEDARGGERGWFWLIALSGYVVAMGWTGGNEIDRDIEIGRGVTATETVRLLS